MPVETNTIDEDANKTQARIDLNFDGSKPVTTIQIRFADGSSIKEHFNLFHTVHDLRRFIITYPLKNTFTFNYRVIGHLAEVCRYSCHKKIFFSKWVGKYICY